MEERLKFLANGTKPRKNKDVMSEVIDELKKEGLFYGDKVKVPCENGTSDKKEKKDKKKDKKRKHSEVESDEEMPEE